MVNWRATAWHAVEAIEDGDVDHARDLLLSAIEGGRVDDAEGRRKRCSSCGLGPMWPGEVERHVAIAHPEPVLTPARPPRRLVRSLPGGRS